MSGGENTVTPGSLDFGVLTLATPNDYLKAIGLALSLRCSNPCVPLAVACSKHIKQELEPYFDYVIDEEPGVRGFRHKVYLDKYSPFETTFFFDSDVLVFKPLRPVVDAWGKQPYTARGRYEKNGISAFGLNRRDVLQKIGKDKLVVIDGAGHALYSKPGCVKVFELAREVTDNYASLAGEIKYADEDVMSIVMTMLDLKPAENNDFFSRHLSAVPGTLKLRAEDAYCQLVEASDGRVLEPVMMHFAANEGAYSYGMQLSRLFKKFGVEKRLSLVPIFLKDFYYFNKLVMRGRCLDALRGVGLVR